MHCLLGFLTINWVLFIFLHQYLKIQIQILATLLFIVFDRFPSFQATVGTASQQMQVHMDSSKVHMDSL